MKRFCSLTKVIVLLIVIITLYTCEKKSKLDFSIGLIADCQYCKVEGEGIRKYSKSNGKLKQCVAHFNTLDLEYTIHLGDFIDRDWRSFDSVIPTYNKLQSKKYHVLGNHDFSVDDAKKKLVSKRMGLPSDYYDFEVKGWRFIVLNGNDVSFHAHAKDSKEYNFAGVYYEEHKITSPKWNGAIGESQLNWLKITLAKAKENSEKVILYCHFPVFPKNIHNLWNAEEVVEIIENYSNVQAYINGHNHEGNYAVKNGIHYLTMKGMVDTEVSSYGILSVTTDSLFIEGHGREVDRSLVIRK
jgi:manganese-dependent ADP-ribose/CDP-alcohol diphosphatase